MHPPPPIHILSGPHQCQWVQIWVVFRKDFSCDLELQLFMSSVIVFCVVALKKKQIV